MNLSIITINYNNKDGFESTILSVLNQTTIEKFEYIVVDGNSVDGSKSMIEKYNSKIDKWVSEDDDGIYNAMNKGISYASGKYILFLNSGDVFFNSKVLDKINLSIHEEELLYTNIIKRYEDHDELAVYPKKPTLGYLAHRALPHQGMYFKRSLFEKYGEFDESFKIVSDWLFYTNLILKEDVSYKYLNITSVIFDRNGISSNDDFSKLHMKEREIAKQKIFKSEVWDTANELKDLNNKYNGLISSKSVVYALKISRIFKIKK